jgi:hypothetical protein
MVAIFGTFAFSAIFHGRWQIEFCWCLRFFSISLSISTCNNNNANCRILIFPANLYSHIELLFSVAFKTFRPWFFLGMLLQLVSLGIVFLHTRSHTLASRFCLDLQPLIYLSQQLKNKRRGNILVWWSLFSGAWSCIIPRSPVCLPTQWMSLQASRYLSCFISASSSPLRGMTASSACQPRHRPCR